MQFNDDLFEEGRQRRQLTKNQKQANKYVWSMRQGASDGEAGPFLDLSAERLQSLQGGDDTLAAARRATEGEMKSVGKGFFYRRG